jgi:hypothetical protein
MVELVLVLPLLLLFLAAMVQFCLLLTTRQQFLAASRAGARAAAQGRSEAEVDRTVRRVLGPGRMDSARVYLRSIPGDPVRPEEGGDRVEVIVVAPVNEAAPNFLDWAGLNFDDKELIAATVMNRE